MSNESRVKDTMTCLELAQIDCVNAIKLHAEDWNLCRYRAQMAIHNLEMAIERMNFIIKAGEKS
jgi:hypothetical protein